MSMIASIDTCTIYILFFFRMVEFTHQRGMVVSFIGGGIRSTRRKPLTCRKSLTNIDHILLYRVHLVMNGIHLTFRNQNLRSTTLEASTLTITLPMSLQNCIYQIDSSDLWCTSIMEGDRRHHSRFYFLYIKLCFKI
jgi:hypothetical protein